MATYGKIYQVTFDPPAGGSIFFRPRYRLDILKKNYAGLAKNIIGAEGVVKQTWQTDQAKPAVKGCALTINLLNKEGTLPLSTFLSTDDDEFKVQLFWIDVVLLLTAADRPLFEGFLVQDDCREIMVDYTHYIQLSATDNLGLLKDVTLDRAPASFDYFNGGTEILMASAPHLLRIGIGLGRQVEANDKIEIIGTAIAGMYNIVSFVENGLYLDITTVEPIATLGPTSTVINIWRSNLIERVTLASIIRRCLSATGIELNTNIYCNLLEENHLNSKSFLVQTLISPETFLKNDTDYDDCYTVLQKIFRGDSESAMLTLFQSNGAWNIVRWDELRYYSNLIPGFSYDKDFNFLGTITLPAAIKAGIGENSRAETGLTREFFRPNLFDKETFNYKNPPHILRNNDLQILGNLLRDYTNGLTGADFMRIKEYKMPWWYLTNMNTAVYYIRVVYDQFENEIERYLVLKNDIIKSYKIEASEGDIATLSFTVKADQQWVNDVTVEYVVEITDGVQTKRIRNYLPIPGEPMVDNPYWDDGGGFRFFTKTVEQNNNITITTPPIPFDSLLYVYLTPLLPPMFSAAETYYSDIRFDLTAFINKSTKIIGHTHKSERAATIKQRKEKEISVDDSPRNFIAGTMFLNRPPVGVIQERTKRWKIQSVAGPTVSCNLYSFVVFGYDSAPWTLTGIACDGTPINLSGTKSGGPPPPQCARPGSIILTGSIGISNFTTDCGTYQTTAPFYKLGQITTKENLFWRKTSRTKLEGTFFGLFHDSGHYHISMLSVFKYTYFQNLNFVFGKLEIDFEKDMFTCTVHEMYKDGEPDIISDYEFKYLYDVK